jgi:hypothetical protein
MGVRHTGTVRPPAASRLPGRVAVLALATFVLSTATLWVTPAQAHTNRSVVRLAVTAGDNATTVHAFLVYADDHEPVADEFVLADVSGPWGHRSLQLDPDRYEPGHFAARLQLPAGAWTLLVAAKAATVGSATGRFTVTADGQLSEVALSRTFDPDSLGHRVPGQAQVAALGGPALVVAGLVVVALMTVMTVMMRAGGRRRALVP